MLSKLKYPIVTDRWLEIAFAVKFFIFGAFGVVGAFRTVPAIAQAAGAVYQFGWTAAIGALGIAAGVLCLWNSFHGQPRDAVVKVEWYTTIALTILISGYSIALASAAFGGAGSYDALATISFALLIFPIFRVRMLYKQLKGTNGIR